MLPRILLHAPTQLRFTLDAWTAPDSWPAAINDDRHWLLKFIFKAPAGYGADFRSFLDAVADNPAEWSRLCIYGNRYRVDTNVE